MLKLRMELLEMGGSIRKVWLLHLAGDHWNSASQCWEVFKLCSPVVRAVTSWCLSSNSGYPWLLVLHDRVPVEAELENLAHLLITKE